MKALKLELAEQGLNGQARKVLEAVPMQEPWAKQQILAELRRVGSNAGMDVVEACLNTLRGRGLIKEPERGKFVRVVATERQPQPQPEETIEVERMSAPQQEEKPDPLAQLADIAKRLRHFSSDLSMMAAAVEDAAIAAEERIQQIKGDTAKLRQLQELLKSLS